MTVFKGSGVAIITPFNKNGIDFPKFKELIEWQIAEGPLKHARSYNVCYTNGYRFHTVRHASNKLADNSGVCVKAADNSRDEEDFYGQLLEIVEVEYPGIPIKRVTLFKCHWYDPTTTGNSRGTNIHKRYKLVDIHQGRSYRLYDPFVLASQACQVYYLPYPSTRQNLKDWRAVCKVKQIKFDKEVEQESKDAAFQEENRDRIEIEEASAGDIVAIAGLADIGVGETVCTTGQEEALPLLHVDEPTIQMVFGTNTSPFAGQDGKFVTARQIEERLFKETNRDVSLKIERIQNKEEWIVSGRGELHLSILIENMRREGYELQVSKPKAIMKEIDGVLCEPYEEVTIEAPDDCIGAVIESLGYRRGVLETMDSRDGQTRVVYTIPSRGLFGFMTNFLTMTKGYGIISHSFIDYRPMEGETVGKRNLGVLISIDSGQTTAYSLGSVEDRGVMFVGPGVDVYEGMIVGEHSRDNDLTVNVTKGKQMTNTRSSSKDSTVVLKRPRQFNLESCLDYINEDELVEVTPENIRLRKRYLTENERRQQYRKNNA